MIAHPLRGSRAASDQINLLHTAFFFFSFCFVFQIQLTSVTSTLLTQITFLAPISFVHTGKEHAPAAPGPQGGATVPVWERRCLLSAVWLGKVRLHSLQM